MNITINNKNYPLSFGTAAIRLFCLEKNISVDDFGKTFSKIDLQHAKFTEIDDLALLVLCAVKDGLRKEKRKEDYDLEVDDFYDFIDNDGDLSKIFDELIQALPENTETAGNLKPAQAKLKK